MEAGVLLTAVVEVISGAVRFAIRGPESTKMTRMIGGILDKGLGMAVRISRMMKTGSSIIRGELGPVIVRASGAGVSDGRSASTAGPVASQGAVASHFPAGGRSQQRPGGAGVPQQSTAAARTVAGLRCFGCGEVGHRQAVCPRAAG
ncbi:zinc knuckle (CCHC-type) family protein [Striga asiatica]|uniref:Zinc knuckle (CCHC-type) family protein n=1 Tax=Striga asiatica TaxID=4170 RepID=A0A5A7QHR0_STRAF|nr:zinc knuckle (CCHC-type) family protein [Striga asiatica]